VDTLGRAVQPALPAYPPPSQPPKRSPRRGWPIAVAVGLALGFVATGVFAITQYSALSAARQNLAVAEDEIQSDERRVKSLQDRADSARQELESANESLEHARDYGETCHTALSGYTEGLRIYYRAVRAGNFETARSLTRQAAAAFRAVDLSYLTCMQEAPDEFLPA
jgi:septal ring factor EnvC (AmiA/AmiB activator)